jgi:hypothetical protein
MGVGNTVEDTTQKSIRGNLVNGVGITRPRSSGSAFVFDGTDDRIIIGRLNYTFTEFTVLVWFNARAIENYRNVLDCNFNAFSASGNVGPRLEMNSAGVINWVVGGDGTDNSISNGVPIETSTTANIWRHVGITRNANSQFLGFLNGQNTSTVDNNTGFPGVFNNVYIGRGFHLSSDAERSFRGEIGLVQMYNRALSAAEVQQNYDATRWRYGV